MSTGVMSLYSNNRIVDSTTGEILLGTDAKSVATEDSAGRRALRYKLQGIAKRLLPKERVAQCQHRCGRGGVEINVSSSTGRASYAGVVTCGSVWLCPVCSSKISNARRKELNQVLSWCREHGYQPVLMTLTARHGLADSLAGLLAAMKLAKRKLHQSREWRALESSLVGHITATEVTHGDNGWHVHFHMLLLVDARTEFRALELCDLERVWLRVLNHKQVMLGGNGYAFDAQGASHAGDYVSKWGAAEEVTLSGSKRGNGKGQTPFELLNAAEQDMGAATLFLEYAKEFKGKRQLVWSPGLKHLLRIIEKSDQEVNEEPEEEDYQVVAIVPRATWALVVKRRLQAELLEVAEQGGSAYVDAWISALHNQERVTNGGTSTG